MEGVEPELKQYVVNLVSALGAPDIADPQHAYKLGDEALACLRDLKKWLHLYDDKLNRWDVARAISETSLVTVDLIEILTSWELKKRANMCPPHYDRIALACLELLVPLTWPITLDPAVSTVNHSRNYPFLRDAREKYKRALLTHPQHVVFRAVLRLAVPSLKLKPLDRTARDEGILKLVVLLFRNLLEISPTDQKNDDIGRSATIQEFDRQKVLEFLITMAAGMGSNFDVQDVSVLESLYYLLRGIDVERIFSGESSKDVVKRDLVSLLEAEKQLQRSAFQPTRHSRFGTLVSMSVPGEGRLSVSGQRAISGVKQTLEDIDDKKKWHKPKRRTNDEKEKWNVTESITEEAADAVVKFTNKFIDTAFNPLFIKIRGLIEQDNDRIVANNYVHFLYLVGWFLSAEQQRHPQKSDFQLVGGCLNHNTFIVVMNLLNKGYEMGESRSTDLVHSSMFCFRNILMLVREMGFNSDPEWVDAADSIKARLFYQELWLDLLAQLPKYASKKSLSFAVECVELTHVLLKMLQEYSQQHTYVFVKAKRQRAKKSKSNAPNYEPEYEGSDDESEIQEADRVTTERKFEFAKFERKYYNEHTLDLYEVILSNFRDVEDRIIQHVLAFFHRHFVKAGNRVLFYRLSMIKHLTTLTSSQNGLASTNPLKNQVTLFMNYFTSKLIAALDRTPSLFVEILFDKMQSEIFYLEHGHDKADSGTLKAPEYELELKDDMSQEQSFAVTVAALLDQDKKSHVTWVLNTLQPFIDLASETPISRPFTTDRQKIKVLYGDPLLRLLMRLIGCTWVQSKYIVPSTLTAVELVTSVDLISKYLHEAVDFGDNQVANDFLESAKPTEEAPESSASEEEDEVDGFADPRLQPLSAEEQKARKKAKLAASKTRKRARAAEEDEPAGKKRRSAEARDEQRRREIKTSVFVDSSDDDMGGDDATISERVASIKERAEPEDDDIPEPSTLRRQLFVDDDDSD